MHLVSESSSPLFGNKREGSNISGILSKIENEVDVSKILEIISEVESQDPSNAALAVYFLITFNNSGNLVFANDEVKTALRNKLEQHFVGPQATLTVKPSTDGSYFPHVGSSKLISYAELLDSTVLATCIASESHYLLDKALALILNRSRDNPAFEYFIEKTFPPFSRLTPEVITQRIILIKAIGETSFYPRPRPTEFEDRLFDSDQAVTLSTKDREDLSEVLFSFLEQAKLFREPKPNSEESEALICIARSMAVGGLVAEASQIDRILQYYPRLVEKISECVASFTMSYQADETKIGAAEIANLWTNALVKYLGTLKHKVSSPDATELDYGKCLVNIAVAQLNGSGISQLLVEVSDPQDKFFAKYRDSINKELIIQLGEKRSGLNDALSPSLVPVSFKPDCGDSLLNRSNFNYSKLQVLRKLVVHPNREIRKLSSALMREIGHQFPSLMCRNNMGFYRATSFYSSKIYQFFSTLTGH